MTTTVATDPIVKGQRWTADFTLAGTGTISGATVTANVRRENTRRRALTDVDLTVQDAANRVVRMTLLEAETDVLEGDPDNPGHEIPHFVDVYVTLSGALTIYGPYLVNVRQPA